MTVIRAALDEMFAVIGQMVWFGLPSRPRRSRQDAADARRSRTFSFHIHPVRVRRSWIRMSYTLASADGRSSSSSC